MERNRKKIGRGLSGGKNVRIGIDARLWNETGVGRYIRNLVENLLALDKKNEYVLFVSSKIAQQLKSQNNSISKHVTLIETNIRWHTIEEQLQFSKVLAKEKLDLVHFPYFSIPIFYDRPFIITIHDLIIDHYPTGKASTLPSPIYYVKLLGYKFIIKQAAKKARRIIAVSQATKNEIVQHLKVSQDKVVVTYEGVEENSEYKMQAAMSPLKDQQYFLYVGNAYPHKNLERLIDAFALVAKALPDMKLILVGKEDYFYRKLQEKVRSLQIDKQVIFTGFVPEGALSAYYRHAVATIVPSLMEGFGLTGLEAMKNGSLVLAAAIPSLQEIYQDAAVYFDPLATSSIHATIQEVLKKKDTFDSYKKRGEKRISFFSWEKMAKETIRVYESSIGI